MAYIGYNPFLGIGSMDTTMLTGHTVLMAAYNDTAGRFELYLSGVPSDTPAVFESLSLYDLVDGVMVEVLATLDVADAAYNNVGLVLDAVTYPLVGVYTWIMDNPFAGVDTYALKFNEFTVEQIYEEFQGTVQWPHLDLGNLGAQKMLDSIDIVSDAPEGLSVSVGYDQRNLAARTPAYDIDADTLPGMAIPIPVSGPSFDLKLVFAPNQVWELQAANLYIQDGRKS